MTGSSQEIGNHLKRIKVNGVYKTISTLGTSSSGVVKTVILATSIEILSGRSDSGKLTPKTVKNIVELSRREDIFPLLSRSFAPSLYGNENVKKAILLQMIGGSEKNLDSGTHLRGDVNILLIGDPSTGKSQFLRHVMSINPNTINTTGRGSSGVGLTAAVVLDKDTGERSLEAGAMVLADKGIVCIDEFDKMNENDRVAVHEVMEQQTVTIAKAGIHVSLNARCSVLAAANPIYGEYQADMSPQVNIGLPESLLSRFDVIFILKDKRESHHDRKVADKVIWNHIFGVEIASLVPNENNNVVEPDLDNDQEDQEDKVFFEGQGTEDEIVSEYYLQSYISYSKSQYEPELSNEAKEILIEEYCLLRGNEENRSELFAKQVSPVTVRTLETLIRLSTALAKLRLAKVIADKDALEAIKLLRQSMFDEEALQRDKEEDFKGQTKSKFTKAEIEEKQVEDLVNAQIDSKEEEKKRVKFVMGVLRKNTTIVESRISLEKLWEEITKEKSYILLIENRQKMLDVVKKIADDGYLYFTEDKANIVLI